MLWPDIIQFGRVRSDVITGMSITKFLAVGHVAKSYSFSINFKAKKGSKTSAAKA